jgi:hypothetical protein
VDSAFAIPPARGATSTRRDAEGCALGRIVLSTISRGAMTDGGRRFIEEFNVAARDRIAFDGIDGLTCARRLAPPWTLEILGDARGPARAHLTRARRATAPAPRPPWRAP